MQKNTKILGLAIIAGFLIRLSILFFTRQDHLIQLLPDDFFISLQLMKNWVVHGIISLDGEVWTNGLHPMFLLVLFPLFKVFGSLLSYDKIALISVALFDVIISIFIYKIVKMYYSDKLALLTSCFWLLNPGTMFIALMGLESALAGFLLSIFIYTYLYIKKQGKTQWGWIILISALYASLFLTRTEFILLGPFFLLDLLAYLWGRKEITKILSVLVIPVILLPWLAYSYIYTGSITQDSGRAILFLTHMNYLPSIPSFLFKFAVFSIKYLLKLITNLGNISIFAIALVVFVRSCFKLKQFYPSKTLKILLYTLLILSLIASSLIPEPNQGLSKDMYSILVILGILAVSLITSFILIKNNPGAGILRENWFLLAFVLSHFLFYSAYFWLIQSWYLFSVLLILTLLLIPQIFSFFNQKRFFILLIFLVLIIRIFVIYSYPSLPEQSNYLAGAEWLKQNTPQSSIIGVVDCGIIAYFSERKTINLDGIVNKEAYFAFRENDLLQYIDSKDVDYLFGSKVIHPDFEPVKIISMNPRYNQTIWKRKQ